MAQRIAIREGLLERLKSNAGIRDDESFARLIGASRATLARIKAGEAPSAQFVAGIALAFDMGLGEIAVAVRDDDFAAQKDVA